MRIFAGGLFAAGILGVIGAIGLMPPFLSPQYWGLVISVAVLWGSLAILVPGKEED